VYPVRIGPDERPMRPGAPTHLAQAPAWVNLSDSPVCSFAACVVQFKDQLCYGFDATGAYSLVIDQTNLLDVTPGVLFFSQTDTSQNPTKTMEARAVTLGISSV
jgi:hypothetical protein